jgi:hypothetical protein
MTDEKKTSENAEIKRGEKKGGGSLSLCGTSYSAVKSAE